jgi:hypothetical protein
VYRANGLLWAQGTQIKSIGAISGAKGGRQEASGGAQGGLLGAIAGAKRVRPGQA